MTILTTEPPTIRTKPPASVVACRVLIGVQGAVAAAATALAGFATIFLAAVTFAADGWQRSYTVPVLLVGTCVLLSFVLLAALIRFTRGENAVRRAIVGCELALAASLVAFLVTSAGREPAVWAVPLLDLVCCVTVVGLATAPAARRWTRS